MRKMEYVLYLLLGLALYFMSTPIKILGLLYLVIFHELGHALVATYKGIFLRFGFKGVNPGVFISELDEATMLSGMVLNLLTMNLILPLLYSGSGYSSEYDLISYIILCIGVSLGDLYSIFRRSTATETEQ